MTVPSRNVMAGSVLARLKGSYNSIKQRIDEKGVYATMSFDCRKSLGGRKLMGVLCTNVSRATGATTFDFRGTSDITAVPETTELVMSTVELAVHAAREVVDFRVPLANGAQDDLVASILAAMVSDSASCTVGAKDSLTLLHLSMLFIACFGPQFNLFTGEILTHPALTTTMPSCNVIIALFSRSTKYTGLLEECMDTKQITRYKLVKRGKTWWYRHLAQVKRLLLVKAALEEFAIRH